MTHLLVKAADKSLVGVGLPKSPEPAPPPLDHPPGWLAPITPSQLLATGNWVTFESLQTAAEAPTITTAADGGTFRAFPAGGMQAVINRCPAGKGIVFQAGTYEANEPGWTNGDNACLQIPKTCIGLWGNAPPGNSWDNVAPTTVRTVIRIKPNTGGNKNWLGQAIRMGYSGSLRFDIGNIHFEGTYQGLQTSANTGVSPGPGNDGTSPKLFTNFFAFNIADGCTARDILSTGWFGNNGAPPGETFGFQWYGSTNGVICRVAVDGRRFKGESVHHGSAGITFGNSLRTTAIDCFAHHCYAAGFVMFQEAYCDTYNLICGVVGDTTLHETRQQARGSWLNHERTTGSVHYNPTLNVYPRNTTGVHITHSNDSWTLSRSGQSISCNNGTIKTVDPVYSNILFGGKLAYETWIPYSNGNTMTQANPPVTQRADGTRIPAKWSFGGTWTDV